MVPELTACYADYQSTHSYRVWRWLSLLPDVLEKVEIRPFSLDTERLEGRGPWDRTRQSSGLELLALGEFAREAGRHLEFVEAAFRAVHEDDTDVVEMWLALGAAVGLDMDAFTEDTERWRAEVGLWHEEARDELGVHSVPALVFDDEHALFLRLQHPVPDERAADRLLRAVKEVLEQGVGEIRRTA